MSSTGSDRDAPDPDELEISLFGPGFGESLAIHLGQKRWMIVDSCLNADTGRPAPIDYLESIGVDGSDAVEVVLATHWHDDHVRGLSNVVKTCENAVFACGTAFTGNEFLTLVEARAGTTRVTAGVREFGDVLTTLTERKAAGAEIPRISQLLLENVIVHQSSTSEVIALSPSSAAVTDAMKAFAALLPEPMRPHLRVLAPSENSGSVALWIEGPCGSALLGADLVSDTRDDRGWGAVLALGPREPAGIVKVPHHGGESGHDQRMWEQLLRARPQAMLTPWSLAGRHLPTTSDARRICELAPEARIAGRATASPRSLDRAVERSLKGVAKRRRAVGGHAGHIRARCGPAGSAEWRVELIRDARSLCSAA